ncbi:glycoside hydrolase family 15 protein [Roseomonas elaeocarpi]|uniref:Glycoside hydrolase family 15 protein n=1 Tax=Roseomonas elaeocarpi TaxID=907779 RepID=A0ABV6JYG0_9PROT
MALRIEDYALVGDCASAALIGRDGSVDWLCWPKFDADACFAALLGSRENGRWLLAPRSAAATAERRYRDGSMILETRWTVPAGDGEPGSGGSQTGGVVVVTDLMPVGAACPTLLRQVRCEAGQVAMHTEFVLRFGMGASIPWVSQLPDGGLRAVAGPDMVLLRTAVPLQSHNLHTEGDFTLRAGEEAVFVLCYTPSHLPAPPAPEPAELTAQTERFWRDWSGRCGVADGWSDTVQRSLLTLKALTYAPTGGIVAAPTTSLPEWIGGPRNWDYRACWLRDATLTLLALLHGGYIEEAGAWRNWLLRAIAGNPAQAQIMYGLAGERRLQEWEVPWLSGYENSAPVRVGNAAHEQRQLDVSGEVMDALYQARVSGLPEDEHAWGLQVVAMRHLEQAWREPDQGIWEMRGPPRHFVHSKVMCWVAVDRTVRSAEEFGLPGPVAHWRQLRDEIHAQVCQQGFDAALNSFVQSYGSTQLDASLLLLPAVGFLPADDPRIAGTIRAVEQRLVGPGGLVLRYDTSGGEDGLPKGEGSFLACSFWLADAWILQGRRAEAERMFERLRGLCNDVGLLSEEYDAAAGRMLGNFPQAFSHIALVNTAYNLSGTVTPATQRAGGVAAAA